MQGDNPFETAVYGDGVVTLPYPVSPVENRRDEMPLPDFIGAASAHSMEQTMVRYNDGSAATAVTEKQEFVKDLKMVNVTGIQILETNALADNALQQKLAENYPPNTGGKTL